MELNTTILVIILNRNGLNSLIKREIVSLGKETRLGHILFTKDTVKYKDTDTAIAKELEKRHIMPKVNFKTKSVTRKRGTMHNNKRVNPTERFNNICMYLITELQKFIKQKWIKLKGEIENHSCRFQQISLYG